VFGTDGMRRPISSGMLYAPEIKETGNEEN
jgi:hypothetical protein